MNSENPKSSSHSRTDRSNAAKLVGSDSAGFVGDCRRVVLSERHRRLVGDRCHAGPGSRQRGLDVLVPIRWRGITAAKRRLPYVGPGLPLDRVDSESAGHFVHLVASGARQIWSPLADRLAGGSPLDLDAVGLDASRCPAALRDRRGARLSSRPHTADSWEAVTDWETIHHRPADAATDVVNAVVAGPRPHTDSVRARMAAEPAELELDEAIEAVVQAGVMPRDADERPEPTI